MAKKETMVTFVLDETGSMQSIKDDTIGGFNSFLETLKEQKNSIRFSLLKFDSNSIDKVYVDRPISEVEPLSEQTYRPGAMTPLIDACYKAILATAEKIKGKRKPNVSVVIQTDGHENASTEYTNTQLAELIKEKTKAGWLFTFIGAGIDAFATAGNLGISAASTMTYDRDTSKKAFAAVGRGTAMYAATGDSAQASFTTAERKATGGHMPDLGNVTAAAKRQKRKRQPKMVDDFNL